MLHARFETTFLDQYQKKKQMVTEYRLNYHSILCYYTLDLLSVIYSVSLPPPVVCWYAPCSHIPYAYLRRISSVVNNLQHKAETYQTVR